MCGAVVVELVAGVMKVPLRSRKRWKERIENGSGKMPLRSRKRWKRTEDGSRNTESRAKDDARKTDPEEAGKETKNLEEKMTKRTEVKNLGAEMMKRPVGEPDQRS